MSSKRQSHFSCRGRVTFVRGRLQNEGVLPLEEVELPGYVAGGERIVSRYHHYLRGKPKGSKISSGWISGTSQRVFFTLKSLLPSLDAGDVPLRRCSSAQHPAERFTLWARANPTPK